MDIKSIPGYEGLYQVTSDGDVLSVRHGKPLRAEPNTCGYLRVGLHKNGRVKRVFVHRIVAELFVENPDNESVVNHINADITDNRADNLEWCSQKDNIAYSRSLGNQNDVSVEVYDLSNFEKRNYASLKDAGEGVFGKWWALKYAYRTKGHTFVIDKYLFKCYGRREGKGVIDNHGIQTV